MPFAFSINGSASKPIGGARYSTPKFNGQMLQRSGRIGRMLYTMGSEMALVGNGENSVDTSTSFLFHFDGANGSTVFTDECGHSMTVQGPPIISTASPKFGTGSYSSVQSGGYIEGSGGTLDILTNKWTIEAWVKVVSSSIDHGWCEYMSNNSLVALSVGNTAFMVIGNGPGSLELNMGPYSAGVWSHRAIVQNGSTITTYKDGISQDSGSVGAGILFDGGVNKFVRIGNSPTYGPNTNFNGNIDEFRVTNGKAVYTANFTPPVAPFPNP